MHSGKVQARICALCTSNLFPEGSCFCGGCCCASCTPRVSCRVDFGAQVSCEGSEAVSAHETQCCAPQVRLHCAVRSLIASGCASAADRLRPPLLEA